MKWLESESQGAFWKEKQNKTTIDFLKSSIIHWLTTGNPVLFWKLGIGYYCICEQKKTPSSLACPRVQQSCCSCVRSRVDVPEGSCAAHAKKCFRRFLGCFPTSDSCLNFRPSPNSKGINCLRRQRIAISTLNYNLAQRSHTNNLYIHMFIHLPQNLQMNCILVTSL